MAAELTANFSRAIRKRKLTSNFLRASDLENRVSKRGSAAPVGHVTRSSVTRSSVPRYPLRGVTHNAERWNAALSVMPAIWNASYKERSRGNAL